MFALPSLLKKLILYPLLLLLLTLFVPPFFLSQAPKAIVTPSREPSLKTHRVRLSTHLHAHLHEVDPLVRVQRENHTQQMLEEESLLHSCPDSYLLQGGSVVTKNHKLLYLDPDGRSQTPGSRSADYLSPQQKKHLRSWWLPKHQTINQTVAQIDCEEGELYENWLFEVLPKINVLSASGQSYDYLLIPSLKYSYQQDSLALLKVDKNQLIESSPSTHLLCSEVLIPVLPSLDHNRPPCIPSFSKKLRPSTIAFLRDSFPPRKLRCPTPKKLFICAKNEPQYYLTNEEELTSKLLEIGFVKVYQEDLNFAEQIHLFSQAQEIISLKRSILANLVFSQPGTQVMELVPRKKPSNDHRYISSCLAIEHQVLYCQNAPKKSTNWFSSDPYRGKEGLVAPIDEIISLLHNL